MINITSTVINNIINTIGARMPETGGILAINPKGIIDDFVYDEGIKSSKNFYIPNTVILNAAICKWEESKSKSFVGMIHSHTLGREELSESDIEYAMELLTCFELTEVYMLLLTTDAKQNKLLGYKCYFKNNKFIVDKHDIKII